MNTYSKIPGSLSEDEFNDTQWFFQKAEIDKFIDSITYLNRNSHWNANTIFFGNYDSNAIEIFYESEYVDNIHCRFDLGCNLTTIAQSMTQSIRLADFVIINEQLNIFSLADMELSDVIAKAREKTFD